jgi:hypothetical protein
MTKTALNRIVFNSVTGEKTIIAFTNEEISQYELDQNEIEAIAKLKENKEQTKVTAKAAAQSKLAALGLTVEDLQALGL